MDISKEQIFTHSQVKQEFNLVVGGLVKSQRLGRYFPDGVFLTNENADLGCQPDGVFVARSSIDSARVRLVQGEKEGYLESEGSPDMVLEVVSASSVEKDSVALRELYWRAKISEYWLVDARGERLEFNILKHASRAYVVTRKQAGWVKSHVFGCLFRLTRQLGVDGNPEYTLSVR